MNALWDHYWPAITFALVVGAIAGAVGLRRPVRRMRRNAALALGIAAAIGAALLWHAPAGASQRFADQVERQARETLAAFEMAQVSARLERSPIRRTLVLSGAADDFQRRELVRIMDAIPGVARARWVGMPAPAFLPLAAEAGLAALAAFGIGLVLAYLVELRRRSRAEWRW
jgi:hypothetical protein